MSHGTEPAPDVIVDSSTAPRVSAFRRVPWRPSDVLIGLAPLLLVRVIGRLVTPGSELALSLRQAWIPASLLLQGWMLGFCLFTMHRRGGAWPRLPRPRRLAVEALIAIAATPLLLVAVSATVLAASALLGDPGTAGDPWTPLASTFSRFEWLAMFALVGFVAPLAEEVFFRGFLYNALRQYTPWPVALVLQAACFATMHPYGLVQSLGIASIGLVLALIYDARKTLLTPVVVHATFSAAMTAVIAWGVVADAAAPRLGVSGETRGTEAVLTEVVPGSPAEDAGLRPGDVIKSIDGEPVTSLEGLTQAVRGRKSGDHVSVVFLRSGATQEVDVNLRPSTPRQ